MKAEDLRSAGPQGIRRSGGFQREAEVHGEDLTLILPSLLTRTS
jgi:hypothetical protein